LIREAVAMIRIIWIVVLLMGPAAEVLAEDLFQKVSLEIQSAYGDARKEHKLTLEEIKKRRWALKRKLAAQEVALAATSETLAAHQQQLEKLSRERDEISKEISLRLADMKELSALFGNYSRNFLALAERSPYSAERLDWFQELKAFADPHAMFRLKDLKALFDFSLEDMAVSREKVFYKGMMVDRGGHETTGEIIRLGHLPAMYRVKEQVGYLSLSPASGRLLMGAGPSYWVRRNILKYFEGETEAVYTDVSGGAAIGQLAHRVTLMDQLKSGGVLVAPILLVGLVALVLTIERLVFLGKVRQNTDALMTRVTRLVGNSDMEGAVKATYPHRNRPTGRVLMAGLQHRGDSREVIESALTEAMLREAPRLERFLGALKVCAAVAPLLGLLGTVTGMINTFQVITTHGTGDPRLMAGGISEAMVTTQVGLAVAIPVMVVAAFLGRRARNLSQDMEEKGLALMGTLLQLQTHDENRVAGGR